MTNIKEVILINPNRNKSIHQLKRIYINNPAPLTNEPSRIEMWEILDYDKRYWMTLEQWNKENKIE